MTGGIEAGRRVIHHLGVYDGSDAVRPHSRSHRAWTGIYFAEEVAATFNCPSKSVNDIWQCKYGDWNGICFLLCATIILAAFINSVSNGSGPSVRVRVRVQPEPLPNWRSGSSINPNRQFGYGSMANSQPVQIGRVISGSPSGSIYRFI